VAAPLRLHCISCYHCTCVRKATSSNTVLGESSEVSRIDIYILTRQTTANAVTDTFVTFTPNLFSRNRIATGYTLIRMLWHLYVLYRLKKIEFIVR